MSGNGARVEKQVFAGARFKIYKKYVILLASAMNIELIVTF